MLPLSWAGSEWIGCVLVFTLCVQMKTSVTAFTGAGAAGPSSGRMRGIGVLLRKGTDRAVPTAGLCRTLTIRLSNLMQIWGVAVNLGRAPKNLSILGSLIVYIFCFFFQVAIKAWHVEEFLATAFWVETASLWTIFLLSLLFKQVNSA